MLYEPRPGSKELLNHVKSLAEKAPVEVELAVSMSYLVFGYLALFHSESLGKNMTLVKTLQEVYPPINIGFLVTIGIGMLGNIHSAERLAPFIKAYLRVYLLHQFEQSTQPENQYQ